MGWGGFRGPGGHRGRTAGLAEVVQEALSLPAPKVFRVAMAKRRGNSQEKSQNLTVLVAIP